MMEDGDGDGGEGGGYLGMYPQDDGLPVEMPAADIEKTSLLRVVELLQKSQACQGPQQFLAAAVAP
jgi:hypothetical protein